MAGWAACSGGPGLRPLCTGQRHWRPLRPALRRQPRAKRRGCLPARGTASEDGLQRREPGDLDEVLKAVDAAFADAEASLQRLEQLPSARPPSQPPPLLGAAAKALQLAALVLAMAAAHSVGWPVRVAVALAAGAGLGFSGYRRGSLSRSGGIAAAAVGGATFAASLRGALVLLCFYWSSSRLTRFCEDRKSDDEEFKAGGQRDWRQVACNGLVPAVLAVAAAALSAGADLPLLGSAAAGGGGGQYAALAAAFLGYFACCCGDTWASELGQLSEAQPRLITSLRPVRKGTNGGVTALGLAASAAGGLAMGLTFYAATLLAPAARASPAVQRAALQQLLVVPFGLAAGLLGSLVDSLLGATVQFTGYNRATEKITSRPGEDVTRISGLPLLTNNAVNLVSASVVAAASAALLPALPPAALFA